jgi:hypothetical protein
MINRFKARTNAKTQKLDGCFEVALEVGALSWLQHKAQKPQIVGVM